MNAAFHIPFESGLVPNDVAPARVCQMVGLCVGGGGGEQGLSTTARGFELGGLVLGWTTPAVKSPSVCPTRRTSPSGISLTVRSTDRSVLECRARKM